MHFVKCVPLGCLPSVNQLLYVYILLSDVPEDSKGFLILIETCRLDRDAEIVLAQISTQFDDEQVHRLKFERNIEEEIRNVLKNRKLTSVPVCICLIMGRDSTKRSYEVFNDIVNKLKTNDGVDVFVCALVFESNAFEMCTGEIPCYKLPNDKGKLIDKMQEFINTFHESCLPCADVEPENYVVETCTFQKYNGTTMAHYTNGAKKNRYPSNNDSCLGESLHNYHPLDSCSLEDETELLCEFNNECPPSYRRQNGGLPSINHDFCNSEAGCFNSGRNYSNVGRDVGRDELDLMNSDRFCSNNGRSMPGNPKRTRGRFPSESDHDYYLNSRSFQNGLMMPYSGESYKQKGGDFYNCNTGQNEYGLACLNNELEEEDSCNITFIPPTPSVCSLITEDVNGQDTQQSAICKNGYLTHSVDVGKNESDVMDDIMDSLVEINVKNKFLKRGEVCSVFEGSA